MKQATLRLSILFLIAGIFACNTGTKEENTTEGSENDTTSTVEETESNISLTPVESPDFEDAILEMLSPQENASGIESGEVKFSYNVKNYELATQTIDADIKNCANSPQGQHIHLILNNEPYTAHYESEFNKDLEEGHYVALSFLSRSYHESIKSYGASNIRQFTVGRPAEDMEQVDLSDPHMFYSRPKGTYEGDDTKKILLDFYLVNTELSQEGNKVRATINDEEFMIDNWQPFYIEGHEEEGEMTIKLELLDANGELIPSPYNPVERTITLKKGETI
ncbi:phosphopeptide-binding protein [Marivirga sp. S37H4]|uniref:Phosphopeptide-binding protein n=1 Tax=Marivirga aurantiaca TaxID=2802615 RepID=A0A934X227_9BACT|nr:phosphopeptide-binding protein [Marivirga aurantiaca]MBK6267022.1 phosphopeptide-binding protein [Marivirga aurantiaca]